MKCPKCGCKEIGQGKQSFQGKMLPINNLSILGGSDIIADICIDCGYIIETRVERPDRFK